METINQDYLIDILKKANIYSHIDTLEFNSPNKELIITKNPFGFVKSSKQDNNKLEAKSEYFYIDEFKEKLLDSLKSKNIKIENNTITKTGYKSLPDNFDNFKEIFIDSKNNMKNTNMFKMRIMGLTYFRSAQEQLMPKYDDSELVIVKINMSDFQFGQYQEARIQERKLESNSKSRKAKVNYKKTVYIVIASRHIVFSLARFVILYFQNQILNGLCQIKTILLNPLLVQLKM